MDLVFINFIKDNHIVKNGLFPAPGATTQPKTKIAIYRDDVAPDLMLELDSLRPGLHKAYLASVACKEKKHQEKYPTALKNRITV